ncbi:DUF3601 domain-containing protein [Thalassotalea litorea]|uniref:DUF3601 domain-containing protein n=1 Tax=Thalassotalea litorea TaxID=2020715 RepID=A0A5R9IK22_9GAMM|nr:DUF3601 domain-containing protein [Thalassotalea litorea]TLU61637.1 DUF3601 domain-containing protein [Thalassotalea litorea]
MERSYLQPEYDILKKGRSYEVIKAFRDFKNMPYEVGDRLKFIGFEFVPYESGLSLFFDKNGVERQLMLCVRPEFQQQIAHNLIEYFQVL